MPFFEIIITTLSNQLKKKYFYEQKKANYTFFNIKMPGKRSRKNVAEEGIKPIGYVQNMLESSMLSTALSIISVIKGGNEASKYYFEWVDLNPKLVINVEIIK